MSLCKLTPPPLSPLCSPAYGELSHYYLEFKRPKVDRKALWGLPETHQDVYQVFVKFLNGASDSQLHLSRIFDGQRCVSHSDTTMSIPSLLLPTRMV